jgi:hypothetical protein
VKFVAILLDSNDYFLNYRIDRSSGKLQYHSNMLWICKEQKIQNFSNFFLIINTFTATLSRDQRVGTNLRMGIK